MVQELVDGEVAATHADIDLIFVDFDGDSLRSKLIDALRLTHKHNLESLTIRVVVDVLGESAIDLVIADGDVDSDPRLEIQNVLL